MKVNLLTDYRKVPLYKVEVGEVFIVPDNGGTYMRTIGCDPCSLMSINLETGQSRQFDYRFLVAVPRTAELNITI